MKQGLIRFSRWTTLWVVLGIIVSPLTPALSHDPDHTTSVAQQDGGGKGGSQGSPETPKWATDQWAVELQPGVSPDQFAKANGYEFLGQIANLPNMYLFRVPQTDTRLDRAGQTFTSLTRSSSVVWFEQQIARQQSKRPIPGDPGLANQWHLINSGQGGGTPGEDANLAGAWNLGYDGTGVILGMVDDGMDITHPDLAPNYNANASYDYNFNDHDPSHTLAGDAHGTSTAGVAGGNDDGSAGSCGVGAAFNAQLAGLRLISAATTDAQEANAMADALATTPGVVQISSNSWGPSDSGNVLEGPGPLTIAAFQNQTTNGRGGRGTIFVWAGGNGGNGDDSGADGYANSRYTISVAATTNTGIRSSYSESGSDHIVNAPSNGGTLGIYTTDRQGSAGYNAGNCTPSFGGTSSAAPLVAGIVALMLQANPNLTWRDVQHILINTAERNDPSNSSWLINGANRYYSHYYGFGRVDAAAAVVASANWTNMPPAISQTSGTINVNAAIPDNNLTGVSSTFTVTNSNIARLEHVEVLFNATHTYRGDLQVILTSPRGTVSQLIGSRGADSGDNFVNWTFMSVHFWDEDPNGTWTFTVRDTAAVDTGTFGSWQLTLYGTQDTDTLAVFNPATSQANLVETLQDSPATTTYNAYTTGAPAAALNGRWVMGDWNADGIKTPGVYATNGVFYTTNTLGPSATWTGTWFGLFNRPPVAGRFNAAIPNDCIGVVDNANFPPYGTAYALYFTCNLAGGAPALSFQWLSVLLPDSQGHTGAPQFVAGDYNADGVDSIAIRRTAYVAFTNVPPTTLESAFNLAQYFGTPSANDYGAFVAGDWNRDNVDSFGLYYQNGYFYRRNDLNWNSGIYQLQRISNLIGASGIQVTSWRNGSATGFSAGETLSVTPDSTPAPAITLVHHLIESDDALVARTGKWASQVTNTASGGGYLYSSGSLKDVLTLEFEGNSLEVYYLQGPSLGSFTIVVDDVAVRTVISTSSTTVFNARSVVNYLTPGPHTLKIVPAGGVVAIDAFDVTIQNQ
ncbi:MAG: S8 family serine peptidase [Chloroflexi bacterium]|nr:S8 family serine peptidase [Chloroflexota bacterium]